jgi:lysophospholipase L1-like esterase
LTPRRALFAAAPGVAILLVALGLGEWGMRQAEARHIHIPTDAPGLKYELTPGGHQNSHGMNERELPMEKPAGTKRIAVLGDSVTHGAFVPPTQVWSRVLENELVAQGLPAQTLNFAAFGYDVESVAAMLEYRALAWQPDVVVYGFYVNDPIPTELVDSGDNPLWVGSGPREFTVLGAAIDPWLHDRSALFRRFEGAKAARMIQARGSSVAPADWDFFTRGLDRLVAVAAAAHLPLVVLAIPPHEFSQPDLATCNTAARMGPRFCEQNQEIMTRAEALFSARNLPIVDGIAAYRAGPLADLHGTPDDPHHPSAEGHRRLGVAVAPVVARILAGTP